MTPDVAACVTENEKVSYRKQIARQHSRHRNFWLGQGAWSTMCKFAAHSLIIMQNLVALSRAAGAHV